jgi:hypothetical protein
MSEHDFDKHLRTATEHTIEPRPWGRLEWYGPARVPRLALSVVMTSDRWSIKKSWARGQRSGRLSRVKTGLVSGSL